MSSPRASSPPAASPAPGSGPSTGASATGTSAGRPSSPPPPGGARTAIRRRAAADQKEKIANARPNSTRAAGAGGSSSTMLRLYTDESPGLKVDPVVVLVLSLVFIFSVVALHSEFLPFLYLYLTSFVWFIPLGRRVAAYGVVCVGWVGDDGWLTVVVCSHCQGYPAVLELDGSRVVGGGWKIGSTITMVAAETRWLGCREQWTE